MQSVFPFLLLLGSLPLVYPIRKIWKRQDVNLFDILQVFTILYYVFIPMKVLYIDLPNLQSKYVDDLVTPTYFNVFIFFLLSVNVIWTKSCRCKYSPFNITSYIRYWNKKIILKNEYVYFFLLFFILWLIPLTNYSNLSEDNFEQNIAAGYGVGVGFFERIKLVFLYTAGPVILLLNFIYLLSKRKKLYRHIAYASMVLAGTCLFLASKTQMATAVLLIITYFYSIKREKLTRKFVCMALMIFALITLVVFPLSQSFRTVKQTMVMNGSRHEFMDVVDGFIYSSSQDKKELLKRYESYNGRSLNVYEAFHWACTREFRGDGKLTWMVVKYIIPQRISTPGESNILGDVYLFKGADIGESILTWYVADWGLLGVFIAVLYLCIIFSSWKIYKSLFMLFFYDSKIEFLFIYFILATCFSIETSPSAYFHGYYSNWLIVFIVYIFSFKIMDYLFHKQNRIK